MIPKWTRIWAVRIWKWVGMVSLQCKNRSDVRKAHSRIEVEWFGVWQSRVTILISITIACFWKFAKCTKVSEPCYKDTYKEDSMTNYILKKLSAEKLFILNVKLIARTTFIVSNTLRENWNMNYELPLNFSNIILHSSSHNRKYASSQCDVCSIHHVPIYIILMNFVYI